jgi:hypothetical protein
MKMRTLILGATSVSLIAFAGFARADDHLFNAEQHGLSPDSQPFHTNKAGHSGDLAPGQGRARKCTSIQRRQTAVLD